MKLWVDDLRPPPPEWDDDEWDWAKTSAIAIGCLMSDVYDEMSLDHDLGGDDTTRPIVLWLCENSWCWPERVVVHSANPVGREWLEGMIARYKDASKRDDY